MTHRPLLLRWVAWTPLWLASLSGAAFAQNLSEVWAGVKAHDPIMRAVQAQRQQAQALQLQSQSVMQAEWQWQTRVGQGAHASQVDGARFNAPGMSIPGGAQFETELRQAAVGSTEVQARLPLVNPQKSLQQTQLTQASHLTEWQAQLQAQQLLLTTAQRYFQWLVLERQLALNAQQLAAVERMAQEAQDRFKLGAAAVTDTHETQARAASLRAQALATSQQWEVLRQTLSASSGIALAQLRPTGLKAQDGPVQPSTTPLDLTEWMQRARAHNPQLLILAERHRLAQNNLRSADLTAQARLDLVGVASVERMQGTSYLGSGSSGQQQQFVGVSFTLPLGLGGLRSAKAQELLAVAQQREAELQAGDREVMQQLQATWLAIPTTQAQVQALQVAHRASQSRLGATEVGHQVGDRTTLDLLNARNDAAAAEMAWLKARTEWLMHQLSLDALAGQLNEASLARLASAFDASR